MTRLHESLIISLLAGLLIVGLTNSAVAQPPSNPTWSLEPRVINISPCENFTLTLWIRDIPDGWVMTQFSIRIDWDPTMMEFVDGDFLGESRGWSVLGGTGGDGYTEGGVSGPPWSEDIAWFTFTFHCLAEGRSIMTLSSPDDGTIILEPAAGGGTFAIDPEPFEVTVNQIESAPVGGVVARISKLEIIAPYLALAGLIVIVSTVYVIRRRKD